MPDSFEFISASDRPALLAFSNPIWLASARESVTQLGYKVHAASSPAEFLTRFSQVRYQLILIEDLFCAPTLEQNAPLATLQNLAMAQRRHTVIIVVGDAFKTLAPMPAFQLSVHAVINSAELFLLPQLIEKVVGENTLFLHHFNQAQLRVYSTDKERGE